MDLAGLKKRYGKAVAKMDVAAPVDLDELFRGGFVEVDALTGKRLTVSESHGLYVDGSIVADTLTLTGHAIFVAGDVKVKKLNLEGSMVVMGALSAKEVRGAGEPFTLTVMGKVTVGLAVMEEQFVIQFLGTGEVRRLIDADGGADELVELWLEAGSKVEVADTADEEDDEEE
jgi:cytoskeletal protein CcmA (bactofilin family)